MTKESEVQYEIIDLEEVESVSVPLHCNNSASGE